MSSISLSTTLADTAVAKLQQICKRTEMKCKNAEKSIKELSEGIFYSADYFQALQKASKTNQSVQARLQQMIDSGSFIHGKAPVKYFERVVKNDFATGIAPYVFKIKAGVNAGDAMDAFENGLSIIGCGEACEIAFYDAYRRSIGEEKFNYFHNASSVTPLRIGFNDPLDPLKLVCETHLLSSEKDVKKGYQIHFPNVARYQFKHLYGNGIGMNVLCVVDGELHAGLGLDADGVTRLAICDYLFDSNNEEPLKGCISEKIEKKVYEYLPADMGKFLLERGLKQDPVRVVDCMRQGLFNQKMTREEWDKAGGGELRLKATSLCSERITLLVEKSKEEGAQLLGKWKKEYEAQLLQK